MAIDKLQDRTTRASLLEDLKSFYSSSMVLKYRKKKEKMGKEGSHSYVTRQK